MVTKKDAKLRSNFLNFVQVNAIWLCQFRLFSIKTPTNFSLLTLFRQMLLILKSSKLSGMFSLTLR